MNDTGAYSILAGVAIKAIQEIESLATDPNAELRGDGHYYCKVCGEALTESVAPDGFTEDFPADFAVAWRECRCKRDKLLIKNRQERRERCFANAQKFRDARLRSDDTSTAAKAIRDFVSRCSPVVSPNGLIGTEQPQTGICFWGNCGSGKTWYASALLNELIEKDFHSVKFEKASALIAQMDENYEAAVQYIKSFAVMVIDDVGADSGTAHKSALLLDVLDVRDGAGKPTIITTNLSPSCLENPVDTTEKRIFSRLRDNVLIEVKGEDRRAASSKAETAALRSRLMNA